MKKKEYKEPFIRVVEVKSCGIICTSGVGNGMEDLSRGSFGGETPEQDDDGYVWAD